MLITILQAAGCGNLLIFWLPVYVVTVVYNFVFKIKYNDDDDDATTVMNKKAQLSLTNPRDAKA